MAVSKGVGRKLSQPSVTGSRPATGPPRRAHERALWAEGHQLVAGVDEVGRGAWAGPLTVGVAVLAAGCRPMPRGLRDSKLLAEDRRETLFDPVARWCHAWAVGHCGADECDRLGMTEALRTATRRAFAALAADARPSAVLLDGNFDYVSPPAAPTLFDGPGSSWRPAVRTVIGGDRRCPSVAAASVLAKVSRDRIMRAEAPSFPGYDFDRNKGYPSPDHQRALRGYGLTALHRRSWAFVDDLPYRPAW